MTKNKKHILVVDDESEDLDTMKTILEKEGYEVTAVSDGTDALDKLTGNGFDIILMDIRMPELSGYELLRMLREKINHHAKMLYVSIVPEKEIDMTDADGFIQKPFSPESLLKAVKKAMED
ncbi:response regulator [Candidatus Woesearchaeota archaeon]|nr:response regulator [Candidatus Woesearchaeota archaeon]